MLIRDSCKLSCVRKCVECVECGGAERRDSVLSVGGAGRKDRGGSGGPWFETRSRVWRWLDRQIEGG